MSDLSIAHGRVAEFHYTLTNGEGAVIDKSSEQPMPYLHGYRNIVPGLEKEMEGLAVGDKKKVMVAPAEGYGERQEGMTQAVPRDQFPADADLQPGMPLRAQSQDGRSMVIWIESIQDDAVIVTPNHPLAGQTLHFDVEVVSVRESTEEERAHGHAHGPGGHNH